MVAAWVAITDCITSLPSALSTATEMVLWWTSRPIYLMLSIGCSFRQAWFTASHSNHSLLRKGRPFIMRAPSSAIFQTKMGCPLYLAFEDRGHTESQSGRYCSSQNAGLRQSTWLVCRLCAEVPADVNSRDTGLGEMPNRGTSGIVGGSDITFRRHRRVVINLSVRLASFI